MNKSDQVVVVAFPLPAQGHLNQMLQFSCLISSYGIPVYYVGSAIHNRQARLRVNGLNPLDVANIHFHDIPMPPFAYPPPDPNSTDKFPLQFQPLFDATLSIREPVAAYLNLMSGKHRRVVVVHDLAMSVAVQDVASIHNAESYVFNCLAAIFMAALWEKLGKSFPVGEDLKRLPSFEETIPEKARNYSRLRFQAAEHRDGDIYNTCRLMEAPYLDMLGKEENVRNRKLWAIGPILLMNMCTANKPAGTVQRQHKCFEWLDKQEPKSVIYVSFGTTVSLSDAQIKELAKGLENSKVKFFWVLRDADKGNIFDGEVMRTAQLPEGFEERTKGMGIVERDWAPQPEILAHPSTGGFMSHCGWNSCTESIGMGVPMAAWPMHSDQPTNAVLITEILKIGVYVKEWNPRLELVKASGVESAVKRLMASEEGSVVRKRAGELAAMVQKATLPGGVSRLELDSFIGHIKRP